MQPTKINWTEQTWGAVSGCSVIGPECKFCYAESLAEKRRGTAAFPNGFDITMRPWKLDEPKSVKKPSLIFCNSTSDWFHEDIPDSYRDEMFDAIRRYPQHRYQVLTKRPNVARRYFATRKVPDSVWLGCTIGHESSVKFLNDLRAIDARVRFVSAEPLLSPLARVAGFDLAGIHWMIVGGESGFHLSNPTTGPALLEQRALVRRGGKGEPNWVPREDRVAWVSELRDHAHAGGVAFWFKQWGGPKPESGGRTLDGLTYDQLPTFVHGAMPDAGYVHRSESKRQLPIVS